MKILRAFLAAAVVATGMFATQAQANSFTPADATAWSAVDRKINDLKGEISAAMKATPPMQNDTIYSYLALYQSLEAIQERANGLMMLALLSAYLETPRDEQRALNVLSGSVIPTAKTFIASKRSSISDIANASPTGGMYPHYVSQALTLIDSGVVPMLDTAMAKASVPAKGL